MAFCPVVRYATVAAVTDAISKGNSEFIVRSSIITSMVKTTPAIGALKIPATAPAAPHPTSNMSVLCGILNILPKFEPMAEPVSTIGASAPTDPPKPMVMELAIKLDHVLCRLMCPSLREMAYRIFVTPWLMSSLTNLRMNKPVRAMPITGYTKYRKLASELMKLPVSND